ncbi:beta-ketoacyl synthase chain length factor [Shewanella sp. OMA3-2]|uniref:beta-ketoacyl synthase chain length factor n=1 Tax=Shewanella sp. OMA3-2 TaxID=2908650 RepID=UPI001F4535F1|nr:beta-ketoacyl synthase chain length factor [Shewanella sp. OMA3-2]UJF22509.1 beta-ketoacyl synthase chain length factor [Shewanella sp. OMA3-2]
MQLAFDILSWSAWTPDFQTRESWSLWQEPNQQTALSKVSPALSEIPAMQRRRFSRLTKMMLTVAFDCQAENSTRSIFASRHGELNRTIGLLEDVVAKQPLSPTAFSQSVHNTGSGIFGILSANKTSSTSIAAGAQSLPQAFIEAYGQLAEQPQPVLLIFADDPVPPVYNEFFNEVEFPIGFGLLLTIASEHPHPQSIAQVSINNSLPQTAPYSAIGLSQLIHHLATQTALQGEMCQWHWTLTPNG